MANNKSGGSIDYYELRRRHQEYKKSAARPREEDEFPAPPQARPAEQPSAAFEEDVYEEDFHNASIRGGGFPEEDMAPAPSADAYALRDADEPEDSESNPFQSFILAFNKIRDMIAARRGGGVHHDVLDDSDDGYSDDEELQEERRGPFRFLKRRGEEPEAYDPETYPEDPFADDEPAPFAPEEPAPYENLSTGEPASYENLSSGEPASYKDLPAEEPSLGVNPPAEDVPDEPFQGAEAPLLPHADLAPLMDEDDYSEDAGDAPRGGGFKRFLNLFIVREDGEDEPIGEDDYEIDAPEGDLNEEYDDSLFTRPREHGASEEEQEPMGEQENKKAKLTDLMADGLDDVTLSRRERRLLRERQEALVRAEEPEAPAFADSEFDAGIDEPTREYKPVPRPQPEAEPFQELASLFGEEDEPRKKAAKADDYDDEDDFDEPAPRKRARRDADDDDDDEPRGRRRRRDDYDDDEDDEPRVRRHRRDDYGDDEDDEPRGRRRRRDDYDDDEDDDDFDEPRRGRRAARRDDYDDYDDYDEDDDAPSFGHYVLGFFKALIAVVLVLAVALFGLYFADQAVPGGVGAYAWLREKAPVIDKILPPGADAPDSALDLGDPDAVGDETPDGEVDGGDALELSDPADEDSPETDDAEAGAVG